MQELEIKVQANLQMNVEKVIEAACKLHHLKLISKNTLKKYPGCIHWHYQRSKTTGTLEITYWPAKDRCWIPLRVGRASPWVIETAQELKNEIESELN